MRLFYQLTFIFFLVFACNVSTAQIVGTLDTTFNTIHGFNYTIKDIAIQSDQKIVVIGDFTYYGLKAVGNIARLNTDGSLDTTFKTGTGASLYSLSQVRVLDNGKILLIGSSFNFFNGVSVKGIARLNADGSLDQTFNSGGSGFRLFGPTAMDIQPDGKILVAGQQGEYNGSNITGPAVLRLNEDGTVDNTFSCSMNNINYVYAVKTQTDGKIVLGGSFTTYNTNQSLPYIFRLNGDGSRDNTFGTTGINGTVYSILSQSDGTLIIGGTFSTANNKYLARLQSDGTFDNSFSGRLSANGSVLSLAKQTDGQIIATGSFTTYNSVEKDRIVRISSEGVLDNSLVSTRTGAPININGSIKCVAIQSNERLIIGGDFYNYRDMGARGIARVLTDGSFDYSFGQGASMSNKLVIDNEERILMLGTYYSYGHVVKQLTRFNKDGVVDETFGAVMDDNQPLSNYNNTISTAVVQTDGKILIGGTFKSINGQAVNQVARLNPDGSLDQGFSVPSGLTQNVYAIAVQPDHKIIIGGYVIIYDGSISRKLSRLNPDGSIDPSFVTEDFFGEVRNIVVLPDNKILVGGDFDVLGESHLLIRLNPDGSIDQSFKQTYLNPMDYADMAVQKDNKIIIVWRGGTSSASFYGSIHRFNADGSVDVTFKTGTGANNDIVSVALQEDGKILLGGVFTSFNNKGPGYITRLNADGSVDLSFVNTDFAYPNHVIPLSGVNDIAIQKDGKIVLVGAFANERIHAVDYIYRMNGDPIYYNTIVGTVYTDSNSDCILQSTETKFPSMIVTAEGNSNIYYGASDAYGQYQVRVDSGTVDYKVMQRPNERQGLIIHNQCAEFDIININGAAQFIDGYDFADTILNCSSLAVEVETQRLRRCSKNRAVVKYGNYGSSSASDVQVKLFMPAYIVPISSIPAWSSQSGDTLIFDIGTLGARQEGSIFIIDSVKCVPSIRGISQCFQAFITRSSTCISENPLWDASSIAVKGTCINNVAHFELVNNGSDMTNDSGFRVYVNDTLIYTSTFKLNANSKLIVEYPSLGSTVRLEADQSPYYPAKSFPRATVEGCGSSLTSATKGLVYTNQQDDLDDDVSIACMPIVDSFDPNDKKPMPLGIGDDHIIASGERIKYTIRFQNTGTDTAYTIRVVDTLDSHVKVSTFMEATSSHPYRLEVSGRDRAILIFNFDNIKLVDSTKNQLFSQGFVSFYINTQEGLSDGTEIKNEAGIYFDYNSPVITNTTSHTIGTYTASNLSKGADIQVTTGPLAVSHTVKSNAVIVFPNPASQVVQVRLQQSLANAQFIIQSLSGDDVYSGNLNTETTTVSLAGLLSGMYVYKVMSNGEFIGVGKLMVK